MDETRIEMDVRAAVTMMMKTVMSSMNSITSWPVAAAVLAMVAEMKRLDGDRREGLVYHRSLPGTLLEVVV